jgi:hypothetical protein
LRYASECDAEIVSNDGYRISIPNDRYGDVDPEFRGCLWGHFYLAEGKHSPLIPYLLSDRPLGKNERRHLGAILAVSEYRDKRDNGRPLDHDLRIAASMACAVYEAWCRTNKKHCIADHGHRGEMKNLAAREIVEDCFAWRFTTELDLFKLEGDHESFIEAVRTLMDKPRHRRDPGEHASFPCPVLPANPAKSHRSSGVAFSDPSQYTSGHHNAAGGSNVTSNFAAPAGGRGHRRNPKHNLQKNSGRRVSQARKAGS